MGQVKATRFLDVKEYLAQEYGQAGLEKLFKALTPEDQVIFSKPITAVAWIDYSAYMRYVLKADKVLGRGDGQLVTETARYACQKQFKGIYKFFISFTTPEFVLKRVSQVWRQFHSQGTLTLDKIGHGMGVLKLVDFPDIPLYHDLSHTPYMAEILRLSSAKNVRGLHPKCIARGDECCLFRFTWEI